MHLIDALLEHAKSNAEHTHQIASGYDLNHRSQDELDAHQNAVAYAEGMLERIAEFQSDPVYRALHAEPIKIQEHGFVKLVHTNVPIGRTACSMVCEAARLSYQKGTKSVRDDKNLIHYLFKNQHTSPFEMPHFLFHCRMPIFVARQWVRHRTANLNEESARYSELRDDWWMPENNVWRGQSGSNKQMSDGTTEYGPGLWSACNIVDGEQFHGITEPTTVEAVAFKEYRRRLEAGVSREMARSCLPLSTYTEWYWQMDLKNLLHFLGLRLDAHAQPEIQVYGQAMFEILKDICPHTIEAFQEWHPKQGAALFGATELDALRLLIHTADDTSTDAAVEQVRTALGNRAADEFRAKLKP